MPVVNQVIRSSCNVASFLFLANVFKPSAKKRCVNFGLLLFGFPILYPVSKLKRNGNWLTDSINSMRERQPPDSMSLM